MRNSREEGHHGVNRRTILLCTIRRGRRFPHILHIKNAVLLCVVDLALDIVGIFALQHGANLWVIEPRCCCILLVFIEQMQRVVSAQHPVEHNTTSQIGTG